MKKKKKVLVKAAPLADRALKGKAKVVKEGTLRRYITEHKPIEVVVSAYYIRKINNGELLVVNKDHNKPIVEGPVLPRKRKESSK